MFDILFRLLCRHRKLTDEEFEYASILKNHTKTLMLTDLLLLVIYEVPIIVMVIPIAFLDMALTVRLVLFCLYITFVAFSGWFWNKFREAIQVFRNQIKNTIYFTRYTVKGEAISLEDFNEIKEKDASLYQRISSTLCRGYCYYNSFRLLEVLGKGAIHLAAIRKAPTDREGNEFTLHALYVNNGWCFDTYSQLQYPLQEVIAIHKGKSFATYSYDELKGKEYEQFLKEIYPDVKKWCEKNDCYFQFHIES